MRGREIPMTSKDTYTKAEVAELFNANLKSLEDDSKDLKNS